MTYFYGTIVAVCAVVQAFGFMMLWRNDWVYRQRIRIIKQDFAKYEQLPSFDAMMWRFWVWDINKFL